MDSKTLHKLMKKIITILSVIWGIFLFPSILLVLFAFEGLVNFANQNLAVRPILLFTLFSYPVVLLSSIILSWFFIKKEKYWTALVFALLPLVNLLIELIVIDIALFLS